MLDHPSSTKGLWLNLTDQKKKCLFELFVQVKQSSLITEWWSVPSFILFLRNSEPAVCVQLCQMFLFFFHPPLFHIRLSLCHPKSPPHNSMVGWVVGGGVCCSCNLQLLQCRALLCCHHPQLIYPSMAATIWGLLVLRSWMAQCSQKCYGHPFCSFSHHWVSKAIVSRECRGVTYLPPVGGQTIGPD